MRSCRRIEPHAPFDDWSLHDARKMGSVPACSVPATTTVPIQLGSPRSSDEGTLPRLADATQTHGPYPKALDRSANSYEPNRHRQQPAHPTVHDFTVNEVAVFVNVTVAAVFQNDAKIGAESPVRNFPPPLHEKCSSRFPISALSRTARVVT